MKKAKILTAAASVVVSQSLAVYSLNAQTMFRAYLSAVGVSTNQTGSLIYHRLDNGDLIRQCAAEQGLTNLMGLHLVYDLSSDAVEVVSGTNNAVVCTPLTFSGGVFLNNTNATWSQRLAWVYWENSTMANGTVVATEHYEHGTSNELTGFSLQGQLQFALSGGGTNAPTIYRGNIVAGSDLFEFDRLGDDHNQPPVMFRRFGHRD